MERGRAEKERGKGKGKAGKGDGEGKVGKGEGGWWFGKGESDLGLRMVLFIPFFIPVWFGSVCSV